MKHRAEWQKVVDAWYDVIAYLKDPANHKEAMEILAARVGVTPAKYSTYMKGTYFLSAEEAMSKFKKDDRTFDSIYGSSEITDKFFVDNKLYKENVKVERYIDPSFTRNYLNKKK
jgi:NitT/TauT family transport system substrate-binding protein